MLQDKYKKDKFFESIYKLTSEMEPKLAQIDKLLEDENLYELIRADFAKRYRLTETTGRKSTPVEVLLRMLTVRRLYNWSYEETEFRVKDSLSLRMFCRVYFEDVPDDTTLIRWANLVKPETLEAYNQRIIQMAVELKVTAGRKMRTDGTLVETNIHRPSDSQLLADSVRVLGRSLSRAKTVLGESVELGKEMFRNRTRSARRTARKVGQHINRKKEHGKKAYRKLVKITQDTVLQAKTVLKMLQESSHQQAERLAKILETFIPRAEQIIDQTVRRIFEHEKVPANEKLVSIFEPHSDIVCRGKAGKPVEYGRKIWFDEVEGGIVSGWRVLDGNPNDTTQLAPSLDAHEEQFGKAPEQVSTDRGVYSKDNEQDAKDRGIKRVVLPKAGYKSVERRQHEQQGWFRRGRRWHNGVEGRISVLKRCFGLTRCYEHGEENFKKHVGWAVVANNLRSIARHQAAKAAKAG